MRKLGEAAGVASLISFVDPATAPSFEVRGEFSPSMSGDPVFNSDLLYGVVSSGLTERDEDGVDRDVAGIAMLLRPLVGMGTISLGEGRRTVRIGDLIEQKDWTDAVKVWNPMRSG